MGYIKHNAIIVTVCDEEVTKVIFNKALKLFGKMVTKPEEGINGYLSFVVLPDGSKEGWEESNNFDEARDEFFDWLMHEPAPESISIDKLSSYVDVVEVRFGGDDDLATIERVI